MKNKSSQKVLNNSNFKSYSGLILVIIVVSVFMSIRSENFMTPTNILNVLRQISVYGILACGMAFAMMTGGIDLTVGSTAGVCGALVTKFVVEGNMPLVPAILIGRARRALSAREQRKRLKPHAARAHPLGRDRAVLGALALDGDGVERVAVCIRNKHIPFLQNSHCMEVDSDVIVSQMRAKFNSPAKTPQKKNRRDPAAVRGRFPFGILMRKRPVQRAI